MTVWIKLLRTGSFVPYASCHRPIRNAWCAWWDIEVVACTFRTPNEEPISWLSWPEIQRYFSQRTKKDPRWSYLLPKNGLGLTTETLLLTIVTSSALGEFGLLRFLVLSHLELFVVVAFRTVGPSGLWNIHLKNYMRNVSNYGIKNSDFQRWFRMEKMTILLFQRSILRREMKFLVCTQHFGMLKMAISI